MINIDMTGKVLQFIIIVFVVLGNGFAQNLENDIDKSRVYNYLGERVKIQGNFLGGLSSGGVPIFRAQKPLRVTFRVSTKREFINALAKAKRGDVVYVDGKSSIDLSGKKSYTIAAGVTLMSNRGEGNSLGALIFNKAKGIKPMLLVGGENVRIEGLRIFGFDTEIYPTGINRKMSSRQITYSVPTTRGIQSAFSNLEIINCEISGWTHAGVLLNGGAKNVKISYCHIHGNQRHGLGYGVCVDNAHAIIYANVFDQNRHDIAGSGKPGSGYNASYNLVFGDRDNHLFDMHGGADRKDNTKIAGTYMKVDNNYFVLRDGTRAFTIRGIPEKAAEVTNNTIFIMNKKVESSYLRRAYRNNEKRITPFVSQLNHFGKVYASNNKVVNL